LKGIHFAMEFLPQQNRRCEGDVVDPALAILAEGKRVVILGGGDTGADCLGTSLRQMAKSVHQFEIMPKPPDTRAASTPWPMWPMQLRTESSHEEGGIRDWGINSVKLYRRRARSREGVARGARGSAAFVYADCRQRVHDRGGTGAAGAGLSGAGASRA
jgi:NADPH-dependent glutamate synthase beta subunit-like oxidoreductase